MYGLIFCEVIAIIIFLRLFLFPIFIYFQDTKKLRRFPSVGFAALTNLWAVVHQYRHTRTVIIHNAHKRHGDIVRVGPAHVSFSTIQAIKDIYGHGSPATKDTFYNAFNSTHLNVSDSRDRQIHSAKRRRFAQTFAQKSVVELENMLQPHLLNMIGYIDARLAGPGEPRVLDLKFVSLATLYDSNCAALFSQNPRFLERGTLIAPAETIGGNTYEANLYQGMVQSAYAVVMVGWASQAMKWVKPLTWWHQGWKGGGEVRDITIRLLRRRFAEDVERIKLRKRPLNDLVSTLLWDKNGDARCLEFGEILSESVNLIGATENTEIALTNTIYFLASYPHVTERLREELQRALPGFKQGVPPYSAIKDVPYLRACIDESLRLRPSLEAGLPRVIPKGGLYVSGEWLEEGTTASVSTRTIHRDPSIFGERPDEFIPERWLHQDSTKMQRGYLAFTQGGRGCIGRNIAIFEMQLIIATLFWRYDINVLYPGWELGIKEGLSAHTLELPVKVTPRQVY
ncbi:cytochrome P450 [Aspergillus ambiguus]|uniref:cytochrome P450 n=1 Tax=Aspergillus ambiguus TaxID=176160 RepID=UPI003CCDABFA